MRLLRKSWLAVLLVLLIAWPCFGASSRRTGTNENVSTYGVTCDGTCDYTEGELANWEADTDYDLVTATTSEVVEFHADQTSYNDTIQLAGATTSALYYRILRPADGEGHDGTPSTGIRLSAAAINATIEVAEDGVSVQDITVEKKCNIGATAACFRVSGAVTGYFIGCFAVDSYNLFTAQTINGFDITAAGTIVCVNCGAFSIEGTGFDCSTSGATAIWYNDTAVWNGTKGFNRSDGTATAKNCCSAYNPADWSGTISKTTCTNEDDELDFLSIIVDEVDAAFVGTWTQTTPDAAFSNSTRYRAAGDGSSTATFTPTVLHTQNYDVYAWWVAAGNRATDAPYTISYNGGSATVDVDQESNGSKWNKLGTYPFASGSSGYIRLSNDANEYVFADAVMLVPEGLGFPNLHLDASDTTAKDQGTDLSADGVYPFDDDIDEDTRSGTWDIGFDEYVAAGPYTLTVGAGKTYATIAAALAAAGNGDTIEVYANAGGNVYTETVDDTGLTGITLVGMVADRGITFDWTGEAELTNGENIHIGGVSGWTISNFTMLDDDDTVNYLIYGATSSGLTLDQITTASTVEPVASLYREVSLWDCDSATITQCHFDSAISTVQYYQLHITEDCDDAVVEYNDFEGSGVYISLWLGTTGTQSDNATVEYNYFHSAMGADVYGIILLRDVTGATVQNNLIVPSSYPTSGNNAAITMTEDVTATIQNNTIVLPTSGLDAYCSCILYMDNQIDTVALKNNILQGGYFTWAGKEDFEVPGTVSYNYMYDPQGGYVYDHAGGITWADWSNNTQTEVTAPGFVGSGIVWETDGTDEGTISEWYALQAAAPAATAGDGTYCGAFPPVAGGSILPMIYNLRQQQE